MDKSEATNMVMARIQNLDPENASKIMGFILIQDLGEKEMIRLAFSPDALLLYQAKAALASHFHSKIIIPNNNAFNFTAPSSPFQRTTPRPVWTDEDPILSPAFPYADSPLPFHRRSCSVNDAAFLANLEEGGGGTGTGTGTGTAWRPCMYFTRGFCKNGSSCKFLHADSEAAADVGFDEMMKLKALQQQRLAAMGHHLFPHNKFMDEGVRGEMCSASRQIYLTFPADSTFKEEDVSNYFSMFGPVQDVRIPYQQKRMFGFVTFVYPDTVKLILAKGNPHFVCDSRVLVKPYKEKGKIREKKHHQQQEEYSSSLSPSGNDSREHFDHPFGPRMMLSPQDMILTKKLKHEADLQHAIELESLRMLRLQLREAAQNHDNNYMQMFPSGIPYTSPRTSQLLMNQHAPSSYHAINEDDPEESNHALGAGADDEKSVFEGGESLFNNNVHCGNQLHLADADDSDLHHSMERVLPDNLFASPTKSASGNPAFAEGDDNVPASSNGAATLLPGGSPLTMASLQTCYLQMPRFSSGQEAIEM
ncbi:zinc finger CCCH domain-containing protein 53-like [Salvia divinorum]|uniref:Zinc finger CCCH domain-containing protein 53-like n=1 Tax=Salvia divinorum TaxID=28513 RepID=A0ABD1FSM7_SALDI